MSQATIERCWLAVPVSRDDVTEALLTETDAALYRALGTWQVFGPFVPEADFTSAFAAGLVGAARAICKAEGVENMAEWIGKTVLAQVEGRA